MTARFGGDRRPRLSRRFAKILADVRLFSRGWRADPLRVGAVVPSGRALAALLTREIDQRTGPVVELGPGTGCVTQALLDRGVPAHQLALVEMNGVFAAALRSRFPNVSVHHADATTLDTLLSDQAGRPAVVVSGLPLVTMPASSVEAVLQGAFAMLPPDGSFYQFTYGFWFPVSRRTMRILGLRAERVGWAMLNLPPASVYRVARITVRRGPSASAA